MNPRVKRAGESSVFLVKSALVITAVAVVLLTPFTINNFIQGRILLASGSLAIVMLCAVNTWNCLHRRYQPLIILFGLAPCTVVFLIFAFRELGVIGALWSYPAALSFYFMLPERYAWMANAALYGLVLPEAWAIFDQPVAVRFAATLLTTTIFAGVFIRFITKQQDQLEALAVTDSLTGLLNRTRLESELEKAFQQHHRTGSPMTLLMFDVDHFKRINDVFGHGAGDKVLCGVGTYFRDRIRGSDVAFRIGGEEFMVLLFDTAIGQSVRVAEEMRKEIEQLSLLTDETVTVSIGVADLQEGDDLSSWMRRADRNLYLAKKSGRNKVVSCQPPS